MSPITRRSAAGGGACLLALTALPVPAARAASVPARALVDALDHPGSARIVGLEVLAARPGLSRHRLVGELASTAGLAADGLATIDRQLLRSRLRAALAGEFRRGDTVRVQGWVLAATEARLCALAALL